MHEQPDRSPHQGLKPRLYFLVSSPDAPGGIARSIANLANNLVERYEVELIGLRRLKPQPLFALDPRITVTYLVDNPTGLARIADSLPTRHGRRGKAQSHSALTDRRLPRYLRSLQPGVVVSTRPLLHLASARHTPDDCVRVAQDHLNFDFRDNEGSVRVVGKAVERLDSFVVLTEADARDYRVTFPEAADKIEVVRNASPWPVLDHPTQRRKIVLAAGRLAGQKGFDRLIEAYEPVARERPGWRLHIYGEGPDRRQLADMIRSRGLTKHIKLKGRSEEMQRVMEDASIFAMSSRFEGLPMVLIEATTKGLPIVTFDCPRGPGEIVVDGGNGVLVPNGDIEAFTAALTRLIEDEELRRKMSEESLRQAEQYRLQAILDTWTDMFDRLMAERGQAVSSRR